MMQAHRASFRFLSVLPLFPTTLPMKKILPAILLAICFLSAGCSRHRSSPPSPPPGYLVSLSVPSPVSPRTPICGEVREALISGNPPAQGVRIGIRRDGLGPFYTITDSEGRFCITPAAFVADESGRWHVVADGPSGQSVATSFEVQRYEREIAISRDVWFNGEQVALRLVYVQNGIPLNASVDQATFTILRSGVPIEILSTNGTGVVFYTSNLVPGEYSVWARDDATGAVSPVRQIVTLSPSVAAFGASIARTLDPQGGYLPHPEWWDRRVGVDTPVQFVYFTSQSAHSGGSVELIGPSPFIAPVSAAQQEYLWVPPESGDWLVRSQLTLPAGQATALWRRILVTP